MPLSMEPESKSDNACSCSEEFSNDLLHDVAAQLSDEQEDKMVTIDPPAALVQPPKCEHTIKTPR